MLTVELLEMAFIRLRYVPSISVDCFPQQTVKFLKRWEYQITWPASWKICMQVKKQQLKLDMEQQTGSKSGKEYVRLYIVILVI